jgi:DNA repair protein RadC
MSAPRKPRATRTYAVGRVRLSITREGADEFETTRCESPEEAARLFIASAPDDGREHFRALFLSARHNPLALHTVSVGCMTASLVHPREVFRPAILAGAVGIVVTHNHPSGDAEPSAEDLALTRRLAAAGTLLGIEILDHIITGDGTTRWVSLKDRGIL